MSAEEDVEDHPLIQMVTAPYRSRPDGEMTMIGLLYAALLLVVILPLLPFIVIVWALGAIRDAMADATEA